MPDDAVPPSAPGPGEPPDPPESRTAPAVSCERMDTGCLLLMMAGFCGIFALPAFFLLGGAPVIIPLLLLLLVAFCTPFINPAEKLAPKAKWMGRGFTFAGLTFLLVVGWYLVFMRDVPLLRE